jgi:hypothetical protein
MHTRLPFAHQVEQLGTTSAELQVFLGAGLLQTLHITKEQTIWLGDDLGCDFFIPRDVLGAIKRPLLRLEKGRVLIYFSPHSAGSLHTPEGESQLSSLIESSSLVDGVCSLPLNGSARCELSFSNGMRFSIRSVARAISPRKSGQSQGSISWYVLGAFLFFILLLSLIFAIDPRRAGLSLLQFQSTSLLTKFQVKPTEEKEEVLLIPNGRLGFSPKGDKGYAIDGTEGKVGKPNKHKLSGKDQIKGRATKATLARQKSEYTIDNAGLLGVVGLIKGGGATGSSLASVFGKDSTTDGFDQENLLGGKLGDRVGNGEGVGLGLRAFSSEQALQISPQPEIEQWGIGLRGSCGSATPLGCGHSSGEGTLGVASAALPATSQHLIGIEHFAKAPEVLLGKEVEVSVGLDKETIRRVIRRARAGITFCYEQALLQSPTLSGEVRLHFVIAPNGSVAAVDILSGVQSAIDECIQRKLSQLVFPAPTGGQAVSVTYPFILQPVP